MSQLPHRFQTDLRSALDDLFELEQAALRLESERAPDIDQVAPARRASAINLIHYLAIRQHDLRALQRKLGALGLSSLGRLEASVLPALRRVQRVIAHLLGEQVAAEWEAATEGDPIETSTEELLGARPEQRSVRIMVTMPSEAATDPRLVEDLLRLGMNTMRINCAHDGPEAWLQMINHLRAAREKLGVPCVVMCDLAGPKLRTGALEPGPRVVRYKPQRDPFGRVTTPARLSLMRASSMTEARPGTVPVSDEIVAAARVDDEIRLTDTRGRKRKLRVVEVTGDVLTCTCKRTTYLAPGTGLELLRGGKMRAEGCVGTVPSLAVPILLTAGDRLVVERGEQLGRPARIDAAGNVLEPATVSFSTDAVFTQVATGERVLFDDGRFEGVIRSVDDGKFVVEITRAGMKSAKLGPEKGINFPDTNLALPPLTAKDYSDLDFVARHADAVALSFVQRPEDIELLQTELDRRHAGHLGKILKIETKLAFERLPELLLKGLQFPRLAVMVARGDLGVEVGFQRLAEVQEEMLWLCEAAHVPVIWATQVLESLTKYGLPSRSEVTDAAMAGRAECVMLNKGPHIRESVQFLGDVLERMQEHQNKKFSMLRELQVSHTEKPS